VVEILIIQTYKILSNVRKMVLKNIAISLVTLSHIIKRTRDTSPAVRVRAYKVTKLIRVLHFCIFVQSGNCCYSFLLRLK
jgi:hypothetical protein